MNYKYQDKILINDIIDRNYYYNFKRNQGKNLCLTFYYNNKFNNTNLIPNFPIPQSDPEKILLHLEYLLNFYIEKQFLCNIKINDELWLTDLETREKIINLFLNKFKNQQYKPQVIEISFNAVHCLGEKSNWFINLVKQFNEIGIQLKLNIETILIDIVDVRYLFDIEKFLLNYVNSLKIKINPNNFVYFTEVFDTLYTKFKDILYLFEEDNVNWTDYKINEYIEFLNTYIDKIYAECDKNPIRFLRELLLNEKLDLISLKNNGVLDDSNSRGTCPFYQSLNILLEDLTINLCPKFQYDDQVIGQYLYENNKITEIEPKYLGLIAMNVHLKKSSTPHCETCPFVLFCKGFCCKESYKYCLNPIIPIRESCEMKRAKYAFLLYKLKYLNVITLENFEQIEEVHPFYATQILNLCNSIGGGLLDD